MNLRSAYFHRLMFQICLGVVVVALCNPCGIVRAVPAGELLDSQVQANSASSVTPKVDAKLPLDATLVDEYGNDVKLGEFFDGKKPVIFSLVYFTCPNLCTVELNSLVDGLKDKDMGLQLGQQYSIVTLSFSDTDTPELARIKKENYLRQLGQPERQNAWHFLTAKPDQVKRVADAVGFGYMKDPSTGQYIHGSALFICTPDGKVSRTIQDAFYPTPELRDSLIFATQGRIGSPIFRAALTCGIIGYRGGRYTWMAMGLVRAASILMMLFLGTTIAYYWWRDRQRQKANRMTPPNTGIRPDLTGSV